MWFKYPGLYPHEKACDGKKSNSSNVSDIEGYKEAQKQRDKAKKEHGFSNLRSVQDYIDDLNEQLQKAGLKTGNEKNVDELGFTPGFYKWVGIGVPNDYLYPLRPVIQKRINDMRGKIGLTLDTSGSFYTPIDNMYGTPTGGDTWYDFGRVPVSHLMALSSKRIGVLFAACNRPATDVMDNGFDIVKTNDIDGDPVENSNIEKMRNWMDFREIQFKRKIMDLIDFDARSGLGHFVIDKYVKEKRGPLSWTKQAPKTKPESIKTFSSYYMTPNNVYQPNSLDYDKNIWNFTGGLHAASNLHHSRVYVYEGLREPLALRGLALGELAWIASMAYLNIQYYLLKGLCQMGTLTVGITVDREFPTTAETAQYLALLKTFQANNFYILGRGAQLQVANVAAKLGGGIKDFMEFLKEDQSAAWCFPKNQLFGRAQGGGLDGAGAIVSKEDYISSNLSVKQSKIAPVIMWILRDMCGFAGLEDKTVRFNIDLHKTSEQRMKEQLMKDQVKQSEMMTEQMKLQQPLFKKQIKLQKQMADVQLEMMKQNPKALMEHSMKDEENLEGGESKKPKEKGDFAPTLDFIKLKWTYDMLAKQYIENDKLLRYMGNNYRFITKLHDQENEAYKRLFLK